MTESFELPSEASQTFYIQLKLPEGVTCKQCVLQVGQKSCLNYFSNYWSKICYNGFNSLCAQKLLIKISSFATLNICNFHLIGQESWMSKFFVKLRIFLFSLNFESNFEFESSNFNNRHPCLSDEMDITHDNMHYIRF